MSNVGSTSIEKTSHNPQVLKNHFQEDLEVAALMRFIREMKIEKILSSLPDYRQAGKVRYKLSSLILWAFFTCIFRLGSKNAFQATTKGLSAASLQGFLELLHIDEELLPHSSTVDNALARIPIDRLSQIPMIWLKQLEKRKLFYNHAELLPNNYLQIACDGFWIHKYDHPHATHEDGTNACPYCLPRTLFKGTDNVSTQWVHVVATFVVICNNLTLPLYVYPLKAAQVCPQEHDDKTQRKIGVLT